MFLVSRLSRGRNGLLISIVLLAFLLGFLSSNCVDAARSKKSSGISLFGGSSSRLYSPFDDSNDDDDDEDYYSMDQAEEQCDGDSCGSDSDPRLGMRGRRVTRKAAATRRSARRRAAQRMIMADEDFGLRDDGASWHWYLLWGSLLFGTLAALGSGAPYAQILLKSQVVDKFKPMFGGHDKELAPFEEEIMSLKDQFKPEMLEKGYQWCQDRGLVAQTCSNCNTKLELSTKIKDNTCVGYCPNCQSTCDPLAGTWFEECELDPWASIAILFYWAVGYTYPQAASRIQVSPSIARAAYAKCVKFSEKALALCKDELYLDVPTKHYETHQHQACPQFKIGGKGKKVEVAVVGKNQLVKDNFAIIGAEVGSWRCFVLPSSIINKTLVDFAMHQRVREGSIVYHPLSLYHGGDRTQYLPQTFMPQGTAVASTEDRKVSVEHVDKVRDEMRANVPELLSAWDYYVFVVQYMYNKKFWFSPSESFRRILEHIAEVYNNSPEMTA